MGAIRFFINLSIDHACYKVLKNFYELINSIDHAT